MKQKPLKKIYKKALKAFSIAEILVVLTIMGVLATLTIPSLLKTTNDIELKASWKVAYHILDEATNRILENRMTNQKQDDLIGFFNNTSNQFRDLYMPYLSYVKSCNENSTSGKCWASSYKQLRGTNCGAMNYAALILNNGMSFAFQSPNANCTTAAGSVLRCAAIFVDVNGPKAPNQYGKDIYEVHLLKDSIKPLGTQGDGNENTCNSTDTGVGCAAAHLKN